MKNIYNKINNLHSLIIVTALFSIYIAIHLGLGIYNYEHSPIEMPILNIAESWLLGNLGKSLALIGFIGTFLVYLITDKPAVLFFGVTVSLTAGGLVGISSTFFQAGSASFSVG